MRTSVTYIANTNKIQYKNPHSVVKNNKKLVQSKRKVCTLKNVSSNFKEKSYSPRNIVSETFKILLPQFILNRASSLMSGLKEYHHVSKGMENYMSIQLNVQQSIKRKIDAEIEPKCKYLKLSPILSQQSSKKIEDKKYDALTASAFERRKKLRRCQTFPLTKYEHEIAREEDLINFVNLVEQDEMISLLLRRDICCIYADRYLLAMTFTYFVRAKIPHDSYNRLNFFAALHLAHDMEEDDDFYKEDFFPFALGQNYTSTSSCLYEARDDIFWKIKCRAAVSKKCCDQAISLRNDLSIWNRIRPEYHGNAFRVSPIKNLSVCGPYDEPFRCRDCLEENCMDSDSSYVVYTSPGSVSESSDTNDCSLNLSKSEIDSGFQSHLEIPEFDS